MKQIDLTLLSAGLPEDIQIARNSGDFALARQLIRRRLPQPIPQALRTRLELELGNLDNLELCYTVNEAELLEEIRQRIPDFTPDDLSEQKALGRLDWIMYNGRCMYARGCCASLFKSYPDLWRRSVCGDESDYQLLEELVKDLSDGQILSCHIHIRQRLLIPEDIFSEGELLRVHMPLPVPQREIQNLKILTVSPPPVKYPGDCEVQPTVYFEARYPVPEGFSVEYAFDHVQTYVDLADEGRIRQAGTEPLGAGNQEFLAEQPPHIRFTPYLRALAEELRGSETNPLFLARRIYDFVTTRVEYRFVRSYACIDQLPEYGALNLKGDCGVMALLFITLCRILGIPAAWQSGLDAKPGDVGEHDWAKFYVPGTGWVYADLSYGASSYIRGAQKRWNYFFGNVDPYRIPINEGFQCGLTPPKLFQRADPYDNQCGEVESSVRGLYEAEIDYSYQEIDIHRI